MFELIWLVPTIPFVVGVVNLLVGRRLGRAPGWLATAAVGASLALVVAISLELLDLPREARSVVEGFGGWITVGSFRVGVDLRIDQLSTVMMLVVTGIGALIHLYSVGYTEHDPHVGRYFAFLNLFVAFMLVLVLADNFLLLFLGWEGVGLCSYLLIGFYQNRPAAGRAATKAFVTTRIGDTGFLIGIALIFISFGTMSFETVLGGDPAAAGVSQGTATVIALLLLAGAVGKSAQVPLHVWLPDAMEGPSPVSALIHAATMVTAGVYLVVRTRVLFEYSEVALAAVLVIGLITLLYGAIGALGQDDLKRSLAYSTISQLGFMFFAAGMREYGAAILLLAAQAAYKALLFLAAGNVMHALDGELDMKKMGGLRRDMPLTAVLFTIGALALAGIPPLAGFFAKDVVVNYAAETGRSAAYVLALIGALLSALYAVRMTALTFFGKPRAGLRGHEATALMNAPIAVLALLSATLGVLGLATEGILVTFLEPINGPLAEGTRGPSAPVLLTTSAIVAVAGSLIAVYVWASGRVDWMAVRRRFGGVQPAMASGLGVDRLYAALVQVPGKASARFLAYVVDVGAIDRFIDALGGGTRRLAASARRWQSGLVRTYALFLLIGAVALLVYAGVRFT